MLSEIMFNDYPGDELPDNIEIRFDYVNDDGEQVASCSHLGDEYDIVHNLSQEVMCSIPIGCNFSGVTYYLNADQDSSWIFQSKNPVEDSAEIKRVCEHFVKAITENSPLENREFKEAHLAQKLLNEEAVERKDEVIAILRKLRKVESYSPDDLEADLEAISKELQSEGYLANVADGMLTTSATIEELSEKYPDIDFW